MLDTLERSHLSAQDELEDVAWEKEVKASGGGATEIGRIDR